MKKTLLIDVRQGGDWALDLIFAGLVRRLGVENVICYPTYTKHAEGPIVLKGDPEWDWGRERRSLGYTDSWRSVRKFQSYEVKTAICDGEVERVFLDERPESFEMYSRFGLQFYDIPVVIIAGHDTFNNDIKTLKRWYGKNLEAMFIDNWRSEEYSSEQKAHIYNWSMNFDHYWDPKERESLLKNKVYDVSFMGYNSHPDRAMIVDHVLSRWGHLNNHIFLEREPNTMRGFIPKSEYFRIMAQSKICLNLRGVADNGKTLRFYEIPYVGSLMLSQDTGAEQVYPFEDAQHCLYFKTLEQLDRRIEMMIDPACKPELRAIAERGHEHAMKHHTVDARMNQIYEVLDGS